MNPATDAGIVLTLVFPIEVEDALLETLLEHPDLAPGFTSQRVEGQGQRVTFVGTVDGQNVQDTAMACPNPNGATGYIASTGYPAAYSGICGPGTLVISRLNCRAENCVAKI